MPDVFVEVGIVKAVAKKYTASAHDAMKAAILAAVKKPGSGMTTVVPVGGKGIQVNVVVLKLAQEGSNVRCSLIAELFELPSRERFNSGGRSRGEGQVAGKIDAVAGECVGAAVADLMNSIGPGITGSQAPTVNAGKTPLIYIAPFQVNHTKDPKAAPVAIAAQSNTAITAMMDRKIKQNPQRFTQDSNRFKQGSGMPAYIIAINVDGLAYDANKKEMVATTKGQVAEHPSGNIKVLGMPSRAKRQQMSRAPRDEDMVQLLVDAAETGTDTAIRWILETHP